MAESTAFPVPEGGDSEDVAWALETAGALWARGDAREAIRWLRRAAETAGESGMDLRAVGLAKVAADLATELKIPPSMAPPPPVDDVGEATVPHPTPYSEAIGGEPSARRATLQAAATPDLERDPRGAPDVGVAHESDATPSPRTTKSHPPQAWRDDPEQTIADHPTTDHELDLPPPDEPSGVVSYDERPRSGSAVRARQALRVAVAPSIEDKEQLIVRVLHEDEAPPDGAHEAMLVAIEAGAHLLSRRR